MRRLLLVCVVLAAPSTLAQPAGLSLYSGRTLGGGVTAIGPEVGWPGVGATILHGIGPRADLGGKLTFNYGTDVGFGVSPGLDLQAVLRLGFVNTGIFSLALQLEPGLGFFFFSGGGLRILLPVGVAMGIHPMQNLTVLLGVELRPVIGVPFAARVVGFTMPIFLVNPGLEYLITPRIALTLRLGFGPGIVAAGGSSGVGFAFRGLFGLAVRL